MRAILREIDRLLRGECTRHEDLEQGRVAASRRRLALGGLLLSAFYGLCMGLFAALRRETSPGWPQVLSSGAKVPLLFFT